MSEETKELEEKPKLETRSRPGERYTSEELMIRLKVFIGGILALTLFGIVFVVLYSLIFVTQPLNAISPIDSKFFELIIPIATFLTGTLSGIMLASGDKAAQMKALEAANARPPSSPTSGGFGGSPSPNGFSAAGSFGGTNFSVNTPSFGSMPLGGNSMSSTPSFGGAPGQPLMSSSGKPMPFQEPHPEL